MDFPSDNVDHPFEIYIDESENKNPSETNQEMTTSLKCIDGEGVDATLWGSYAPEIHQRPSTTDGINQTSTPGNSSTAVEVLSSQMVSDIIQGIESLCFVLCCKNY